MMNMYRLLIFMIIFNLCSGLGMDLMNLQDSSETLQLESRITDLTDTISDSKQDIDTANVDTNYQFGDGQYDKSLLNPLTAGEILFKFGRYAVGFSGVWYSSDHNKLEKVLLIMMRLVQMLFILLVILKLIAWYRLRAE